MNTSVLGKIKQELEQLPSVLSARVENKKKLLDTEKDAYEKQQSYLSGNTGKLRTKYIFIEEEDVFAAIHLSQNKNSPNFLKLKYTASRIVAHHINEYKASHDKLTEIFNRHGLEKKMKEITGFTHLTYCISDIDNFKQINDSHSHDHGDKVLKELAKSLRKECNKHKTAEKPIIYARLGGEEFVIAIFSNEEENFIPELIRANIGGSTEKTNFTSSLGFTSKAICEAATASDISQLYREADSALYKSKREGKNRSTKFNEIRKHLGKVLETDPEYKIIVIDAGKNAGVCPEDRFIVYPKKFSGRTQFIIDDGRSKKPIGTYPKIEIGRISPFQIQEEISFCRALKEEDFEKITPGSCLELIIDDFSDDFLNTANAIENLE
ncbi:GGDEF domain-containing protein [Ectopseudomonas composti]|uniref:GGDEF domain-containing protein n=1 Tax=Ectopseudomonas composti TaxID=658457 RepID=UPI0009E95405|nr:GGDEF domain-containing protein [Pseudomonas composti]